MFEINNIKIKDMAKTNIDELMEAFKTTTKGLSQEEASKRLLKMGKNKLPSKNSRNVMKQFITQFTHFMAILLWASGILAFIAGMPELGIAVWVVVIVNALFSFFQEFKADKALEKLSKMIPRQVKVFRDGKLHLLPSEDIVTGDVLRFEAGDSVSADCRVIESDGLSADLSMLTGESVPVFIEATTAVDDLEIPTEYKNLIFAGATITEGSALALVYSTGANTQLGKVSSLTSTINRGESTLEKEVRKIGKIITMIAVSMGVLCLLLAVFGMGMDLQVGIIFAIGITVANVPEGLLPTVSLSLAVGVQRMARQKALVRRLSSVETLSATTVICTDKTGTITENKLTVREIWTMESQLEVSGTGYYKAGEITSKSSVINKTVEKLLVGTIVCSDAHIKTDTVDPNLWDVIGDPTEAAMLIAAEKIKIDSEIEKSKFKKIFTVPFSSHKKMMSVVATNLSDERFPLEKDIIFTKGAPVEVIQKCSHICNGKTIDPLQNDFKDEIIKKNDEYANSGYRVLGIAYEVQSNGPISTLDKDILESDRDMIFLGLVAMIDPPRVEVQQAIKDCRAAGIKITIITGDYGLTTAAIAKEVGLITGKYEIYDGSSVDKLTNEDLGNLLRSDQQLIFSRTTPQSKLRIVEAYKNLGEIVAVTGDGINDTLALKSAHIGIAMGKGGSDIARESADMILLDDNFATIIKAVEEGRSIYSNIRKFMTYILASNIPEIIPFLAMILLKVPPALTILQILAIDLGTDILPALSLGAEKPEKGILKEAPRKLNSHLLDKKLLFRAYGYLGILEAVISMSVFFGIWWKAGYSFSDLQNITSSILDKTAEPDVMNLYIYSTTMTLLSIISCQIGNLFVCRSEKLPFWHLMGSHNRLIVIGLIFEIALASSIVFVPGLSFIFQTTSIGLDSLKILVFCPLILIFFEESRKLLFQKFFKPTGS